MVKQQIHTINPDLEWREFLTCGSSIRQRNDPQIFPLWRDSDNYHLIQKSQPERQFSFWCTSGGRVEGRIGAYYDTGSKTGYIGYYECDPDLFLSMDLLEHAMSWLRSRGCTLAIGPVNGSTWYPYRFNTTSRKPMFPGEPFQPMYYVSHWESAGFEPVENYHSSYSAISGRESMTLNKLKSILVEKNLYLKPLEAGIYQQYRLSLYELLNISFTGNPHFKPVGMEEFGILYDHYPQSLPEGFSYILLNEKDQVKGIFLTYPEPYHKLYTLANCTDPVLTTPKLIVKTVLTHPDLRNQNIATLMVNHFFTLAKEQGIPFVVLANMYEKNVSAKAGNRKFHTQPVRHYSLFMKEL